MKYCFTNEDEFCSQIKKCPKNALTIHPFLTLFVLKFFLTESFKILQYIESCGEEKGRDALASACGFLNFVT